MYRCIVCVCVCARVCVCVCGDGVTHPPALPVPSTRSTQTYLQHITSDRGTTQPYHWPVCLPYHTLLF